MRLRLAVSLVAVGAHVALAQSTSQSTPPAPGPGGLSIPNARTSDFPPFKSEYLTRMDTSTTEAQKQSMVVKILEAGNFDVINFHNVSLVGGPGVLSAGSGLKVYTAHEHWLVCPTHVLWRHGRESCTGKECTRCVIRERRPPQPWRYTGYLERQLRIVDLFLAMSEFSRDKHHEFGFPFPMQVLPNFLPDPEPEKPAAWSERPQQRPYFLFVGRLERIKGLDDVIPVFDSYPDADLLVAGDGDHAPVLKRLAAGNPRVKFLGRVPLEDLPRYYRHAIALVAGFGRAADYPRQVVDLATTSGMRSIDIDLDPDTEKLRQEIRAEVAALKELPRDERTVAIAEPGRRWAPSPCSAATLSR